MFKLKQFNTDKKKVRDKTSVSVSPKYNADIFGVFQIHVHRNKNDANIEIHLDRLRENINTSIQ